MIKKIFVFRKNRLFLLNLISINATIVDRYLFFNYVITRINAERARDTVRTSG